MKNILLILVGVVLGIGGYLFVAPLAAQAAAVSWDRPSAGRINPLFLLDSVYGNIFIGTSTTQASVFPYASTTALSVSSLTSGRCVQTGTGGILTTASGACAAASSDNIATSSAETSGRIPFWTSTAATPALLSGGSSGLTWNSTGSLLTATNASTTAFSADSVFYSPVTSGVLIGGATRLVTGGSAQNCTNQFLRSMSAVYIGGCATVGAADVSLANLTATDATLTFSGTYNGSTARTIGINLANPNTWTALQTINYATTTGLTVSGQLGIPAAANPTIGTPTSGFGVIAVDTTAASSSLHWKESTGNEFAVFASTSVAFNYSTSTPAGTTTLVVAGPTRKLSYSSIGCTSVGGTANIQLGNGTASTTMVTSGTSLTTAFTNLGANSTFDQGQSRLFAIGTFSATTVTQVTCSLMQGYDPN